MVSNQGYLVRAQRSAWIAMLFLVPSAALANHQCCEFALPQGCASGPGVTQAVCEAPDVGGVFMANKECSLATGNCVAKTNPPSPICCSSANCATNHVADALDQCNDVLAIGACCVSLNHVHQSCQENLSAAQCDALVDSTHSVEYHVGQTCTEVNNCVPAVSTWGIAVLTLLTLSAATVVIMRRRAHAAV